MFDKKGLVNRLLVLFQRRVLLLNTNKKRAFFVFYMCYAWLLRTFIFRD